MNKIEWLTSLENGKRTVAILLIGIVSVFGMWVKSEFNRTREKEKSEIVITKLREEIVIRTDAANAEKLQLINDCNALIQKDLRDQLEKTEKTLNKTDKIVETNEKLIKKIKNH